MKLKIWITRDSASGLISRGLGQVFVWFQEPCLDIEIANDDPFSNDNDLQDNLREYLNGVLFGPNCRYNYLYRNGILVKNGTNEELSEELIKLYEHRKLRFKHEVLGSGPKVHYRPNSVQNIFGFDNDISDIIWKMVIKDFQDIEIIENDADFYKWKEIEEERPWYNFCKELEINITL